MLFLFCFKFNKNYTYIYVTQIHICILQRMNLYRKFRIVLIGWFLGTHSKENCHNILLTAGAGYRVFPT